MTPTLIYLFRIGALLVIAYTLFMLVRTFIRRKHVIPKNRPEWLSLVNELVFLALGILLLFIVQKNYVQPMKAVQQFQERKLPEVEYTRAQTGTTEKIGEQQQGIIILNIWATWCGPCRREMPELEQLQKNYGQDVKVVALSDEDPVVINKFLEKNKFSFEIGSISGSNDWLNQVNTRPVSILLVNGLVKEMVIGARGYGFFRDWVETYRKK